MRKLTLTHVLVLFLISVAMTVFAWPTSDQVRKGTGAISGWDNASATWRPIAVDQDTGALITDAEVTIGNITMETTIVPITEWETQTVTLVANTAQDIATNITGSRRFIALKSHTADSEFWVAFNASATLSAGLFAVDSLYIEVPDSVSVSLIASEAVSISVTEGGY